MVAALLMAAALGGASFRGSPAAAQANASFDFSPHETRPGSSVDIVATCAPAPGVGPARLVVALDELSGDFAQERTFFAGPEGMVRAAFGIPPNAPPGSYFLYGSCVANGAAFFRHTRTLEVLPPAGSSRVSTEVPGTTPSRSDDLTGILRVLVVLAAIGSALLVGFGEWTRRHPAGNHHRRAA